MAGSWHTWVMTSGRQFRPPPFPAYGSAAYRAQAQAVADAKLHLTPKQRQAALFWAGDGRLALRLTDFVTSANTDLFVWLDRSSRPRTTVQAKRADHRVLAPLKSTLGEQNYLLPAGTTAGDVRSVVIWCEPVQIAYTAAALHRST